MPIVVLSVIIGSHPALTSEFSWMGLKKSDAALVGYSAEGSHESAVAKCDGCR